MAFLNSQQAGRDEESYDPARRQNPYAAERALFYATSWGSADTALKQIESGDDYPDAFMRSVCDELRQIRFVENKAALAAPVKFGRAA